MESSFPAIIFAVTVSAAIALVFACGYWKAEYEIETKYCKQAGGEYYANRTCYKPLEAK